MNRARGAKLAKALRDAGVSMKQGGRAMHRLGKVMRVCRNPNCRARPVFCLGLCAACYSYQRRHEGKMRPAELVVRSNRRKAGL